MWDRRFRSDTDRRQEHRDRFDPIAEGRRYNLDDAVSDVIWEVVQREATDPYGRYDEAHAERRFRQVAERAARRGGKLGPEPGKVTRIEGRDPDADPFADISPGKVTRVEAEERRQARRRRGGHHRKGPQRAPSAVAHDRLLEVLGSMNVDCDRLEQAIARDDFSGAELWRAVVEASRKRLEAANDQVTQLAPEPADSADRVADTRDRVSALQARAVVLIAQAPAPDEDGIDGDPLISSEAMGLPESTKRAARRTRWLESRGAAVPAASADLAAPEPGTTAEQLDGRAASPPLAPTSSPVPVPFQARMEEALGESFSGVTAHVGEATALASHGARGAAWADTIVFASPDPDPGVVAHELAHVTQLRRAADTEGGDSAPQRAWSVSWDAAEIEADHVAQQVAAGAGRVHVGARPAAAISFDTSPAPIESNAAQYLNDNAERLRAALDAHLGLVDWPQPDPRLPWSNQPAFRDQLVASILSAIGDCERPEDLKRLCHPAQPVALVDQIRPVGRHRPGTPEIPSADKPFIGGPVGPSAWLPSIGLSIAQVLESSIVESLRRLAPRWIAAADDRASTIIPFEDLVTSHPMDRWVGRAMTDSEVFAFEPDPENAGKRAPIGRRRVKTEWQEGQLWNWVKATEPADATVEEVAASLYKVAPNGDEASYLAYNITAAPPLFGLPPAWARRFPGAHAPQDAAADENASEGSQNRVLAVAGGAVSTEIALSQASNESTPTVGGIDHVARSPIEAIRDLIGGNQIQCSYLMRVLTPWGHSSTVMMASLFMSNTFATLATQQGADLAPWARVFSAQRQNLLQIAGGVRDVLDKASKMGISDPQAAEANMLRDVLGAWARAAATSHLADTCREQIALAGQQQARVALAAVEQTGLGLNTALEALGDQAAVGDPQRQSLLAEGSPLVAQGVDLRSRLLAGKPVDAHELELYTLNAEQVALTARVRGVQSQLRELQNAAHDASDDFSEQVAAGFSGKFSSLEGGTEGYRNSLERLLLRMKEEVDVATLSRRGESYEDSQRTLLDARRKALSYGQLEFQRVAQDPDLVYFLRHGASLIQWQSFRTACIKMAAMIGVSIVASVAGRAFGSLIGRIGGGQSVMALSTAGRVAAGTGNFVADLSINAIGQTAIQGTDLWESFKENAIFSGAMLVVGRIASKADELGRIEDKLHAMWRPMGKVGVVLEQVVKISAHAVMGAAIGYVAHRIASGKSEPPPETLQEWLMQGAAVAIGRYVHQGMEAHLARVRPLGKLPNFPQGAKLLERTRALSKLSGQVEQHPNAEKAMELLGKRREVLQDEIAALDSLLQDPAMMRAAGLDADAVRLRQGEAYGQLGEVNDRALGDITLHMSKLEELVPGAEWRGSREDIAHAIAKAEAVGIKVHAERDQATSRWHVTLDGRPLTIHEKAKQATGPVVLAGHDLRLHEVAKWVQPMDGTLDVIVHADATTFSVWRDGGWIDLDHRRLANYIKSKGGRKYRQIRLVACEAGAHADAIAKHLANKTGKDVLAATEAVTSRSDGSMVVGADGKQNTGEWKTFRPGQGRSEAAADAAEPQAPEPEGNRRPTWQESERRVSEDLDWADFSDQRSFHDGKDAPRGSPDSTRPDNYSPTLRLSVDVKNYDVSTSKGRSRLVQNVIDQVKDRGPHLPEGTRQGVVIDVRGQKVKAEDLASLRDRIVRRSEGLLKPDDVVILTDTE